MKQLFFIATALMISMTASADGQSTKKSSNLYGGKVAELILSALKQAGVKPTCSERGCTFAITDFQYRSETDGCGGGTTGYDTSFVLAGGKKIDSSICEGEAISDQNNKSVGDDLVEIFVSLDLGTTSGWAFSINLSKVACVTSAAQGSAEGTLANCQVTLK